MDAFSSQDLGDYDRLAGGERTGVQGQSAMAPFLNTGAERKTFSERKPAKRPSGIGVQGQRGGAQDHMKLRQQVSVPNESMDLVRKVTNCIPDPTLVSLFPESHTAAKLLAKV